MRVLVIYYLEEGGLSDDEANKIKEKFNVVSILEWENANQLEGVQYPYMEIKEF